MQQGTDGNETNVQHNALLPEHIGFLRRNWIDGLMGG